MKNHFNRQLTKEYDFLTNYTQIFHIFNKIFEFNGAKRKLVKFLWKIV